MPQRAVKATVVIPLYNGEEFLEEILEALAGQKCPFGYEVLIIDSGSTDKSLEIISKYPKVRLHQIPNTEFGHGRTRNLGAKLAKGDFVVYLVQDAVPIGDSWLKNMVEPFELSDKVFCVFGKQVPRPADVAPLKREVYSVFKSLGPDDALMVHHNKSLIDGKDVPVSPGFFSDVNSAVRKDYLLNKISYRDVNYAEDQALGMDIMAAGYIKVYTPLGAVTHSHNYKLREFLRRKYDEHVGLKEATGYVTPITVKGLTLGWVKDTVKDYRFIAQDKDYSFKRKLYNLWISPFYNINLRRAIWLARRKGSSSSHRAKYSLEAKSRSKGG